MDERRTGKLNQNRLFSWKTEYLTETWSLDFYRNFNLSFSKGIKYGRQNIMLGLNVFNLFDIRNSVDIWPLTGKPDDPGAFYTNFVGLPGTDPNGAGVKAYLSNSFFDQP